MSVPRQCWALTGSVHVLSLVFGTFSNNSPTQRCDLIFLLLRGQTCVSPTCLWPSLQVFLLSLPRHPYLFSGLHILYCSLPMNKSHCMYRVCTAQGHLARAGDMVWNPAMRPTGGPCLLGGRVPFPNWEKALGGACVSDCTDQVNFLPTFVLLEITTSLRAQAFISLWVSHVE